MFQAALNIGPFSFTSGTLPDLTTGGKIATPDSLKEQFRQAMTKALEYLHACGHSPDQLRFVIILTTEDVDDSNPTGAANYAEINEVWTELLGESPKCCRMAFQVAGLPKGAMTEVFGLSVVE